MGKNRIEVPNLTSGLVESVVVSKSEGRCDHDRLERPNWADNADILICSDCFEAIRGG